MLGIAAIVFFLLFGAAGIVVGILHEARWWKRRNWRRVAGQVVEFDRDQQEGVLYFSPRIEYEIDGATHIFTSDYSVGNKPSFNLGDQVVVLASPDGHEAEQYTASNRFLFTFIPLVFGALFVLVALTMKPRNEAEGGADQPSTAPESKSEGKEKPKPKSEGRTR